MAMISVSKTTEAPFPVVPEKPKILLVITKADIGGAQIHLLQILRNLADEFQFLLATGEDGFLTERARVLGIQVAVIPALVRPIKPLQDFAAIRAVARQIGEYSPDLVHAHSFKAGLVARLAARLTDTPSLFTAHGWAFTPGAPPLQRMFGLVLESMLCRLCQGVVTICRHDYLLASRWKVGTQTRRHLVRNAADPVPVAAAPDKGPVRLLTIGRLTRVKNHKLMLQAMALLPEAITLKIIGDGSLKQELGETVVQLGLGDRVSLVGERLEPGESLADTAIFVMSSDFEGLPISLLEAMSAGLPVVSTDVGGVAEAVLDHETGFLVPRGDYKQLANKIRVLAEDPALRKTMGDRGRTHYQQNFTTSRFTSELRKVYQNLLDP